MDDTMKFDLVFDRSREIAECIDKVYEALTEKGYDPVSQIVGYI